MCYLLLILTLQYNPLHATGLELLLGVADGAQRRLSYVNMVMGKLISLPLAHGYVHCVLYPLLSMQKKLQMDWKIHALHLFLLSSLLWLIFVVGTHGILLLEHDNNMTTWWFIILSYSTEILLNYHLVEGVESARGDDKEKNPIPVSTHPWSSTDTIMEGLGKVQVTLSSFFFIFYH